VRAYGQRGTNQRCSNPSPLVSPPRSLLIASSLRRPGRTSAMQHGERFSSPSHVPPRLIINLLVKARIPQEPSRGQEGLWRRGGSDQNGRSEARAILVAWRQRHPLNDELALRFSVELSPSICNVWRLNEPSHAVCRLDYPDLRDHVIGNLLAFGRSIWPLVAKSQANAAWPENHPASMTACFLIQLGRPSIFHQTR
jgi:hypothetical protein